MVRVLISNADLILTHPVGVNNADKLLKNPYDCISYTFLLSHGAGRLNLPIWYDESVLLNVDSNIFDPALYSGVWRHLTTSGHSLLLALCLCLPGSAHFSVSPVFLSWVTG